VHVNRQTLWKLCSWVNGFILDVPIGTPQLNIASTAATTFTFNLTPPPLNNIQFSGKYEGESNENLKMCDKNSNHSSIVLEVSRMILMVLKMADRWQYDTTDK